MTIIPPRVVLFDWDNTLVHSGTLIRDALRATFEAMGHPLTDEQMKWELQTSARHSFARFFGDRAEKAHEFYAAAFESQHLDHLQAQDDVVSVLERLKKLGLHVGVVSSKRGRFLRLEVSQLGWEPYFRHIIGAEDHEEDKPSPIPLIQALQGAGVEKGRDIWFVGDKPIDMQCAAVLGGTAILFGDEDPELDKFGEHVPHIHVKNWQEFHKLLDEMGLNR